MAVPGKVQTRKLTVDQRFQDAQTRKLLPEERSAVENYLDNLSQIQQVPGPTGASAAPISLTLNAESNSVVILTHSITRYGITTDDLINGATTSTPSKSICRLSGNSTSMMKTTLS